MKRVHQFKRGDLIRFNGVTFRIMHDAQPVYGFGLWVRENGKLKNLHGPVAVAEARGEHIRGRWLGPDRYNPFMPYHFAGDFQTGMYAEEAAQ